MYMLQASHTFEQVTVDDSCRTAFRCFEGYDWPRQAEGCAMHGQFGEDSGVVSLSRARNGAGTDNQLDKAGQTILQLVAQAAGIADENSRHALGMAQKLSDQLRAAEDRIAALESELAASQESAERAEQWLHRVYTEIEDQFLRQKDSRPAMRGAPQSSQGRSR
jgi:hypothetical protein